MYTFKPFRFWCQKVLPLVYDDSLSYYELLCKLVKYLNDALATLETMATDLTNLQALYVELKNYVDGYFDTANFQEMVDAKLDEMAENGTLGELIASLGNVVKFYEDASNITATEDDVIFIDGEKYIVESSNNGYGTEINDGLFANMNPGKRQTLNPSILSKYAMVSDLTGGETFLILQGGCYDETNNRYAFWFDHTSDDVQGCLVLTDSNLNVITRTTHNIKHVNDMTWCPDKNQYVGCSGSYFYTFDTAGNLVATISQTTPSVGNIGWDDKYKRFVGFGGDLTDGFYLKIMDVNFTPINSVAIPRSYDSVIYPNQNSYTAWQGACIVDSQFYLCSSVFYNDGHKKCEWMLNHFDTTTGEIIDTTTGFYYNAGCEAEFVCYNGRELVVWGYTYDRGYKVEGAVVGVDETPESFPLTKGGYAIYYADGTANGDGMSPTTPCNNFQCAVAMACRLPNSTIYLLTDVDEIALVSGGHITIEGNGHTISAQIDVENGAYVSFNNVVFTQSDTNPIVYAQKSRVDFIGCTVNSSSEAEYVLRVVRGRAFIYNCTCNDANVMLSAASGSFVGVETCTGVDSTYCVSANSGSVACLNGRADQITGFTHAANQYGGIALIGGTSAVDFE